MRERELGKQQIRVGEIPKEKIKLDRSLGMIFLQYCAVFRRCTGLGSRTLPITHKYSFTTVRFNYRTNPIG